MRLIKVEFVDARFACQSCGHDIQWRYTLQGESTLIVGSDCAKTLLGPSDSTPLTRRANKAATQWRQGNPAPREGEQRADYIQRRMGEMAHAFDAWQGYRKLLYTLDQQWGTAHTAAMKALEKQGFFYPDGFAHDEYGDNGHERTWDRKQCQKCQALDARRKDYDDRLNAMKESLIAQIEQEFIANRFDFLNKAGYDIRKV